MGDYGNPSKDKWVCPNDRQLALHAKLKVGWSVKSTQLQSFSKPQQLDDSEQETIMTVIRKADYIDRREQERIGRLVDRLENMKKNAIGNGMNQCVLCADNFGLLGATSLICNNCKKAVCTKCGVDTFNAHKDPMWLCKICAETREMWKKSGAWFFKGLPKYVLPEKKLDIGSKNLPPSAQKMTNVQTNSGARNRQGRNFHNWAQDATQTQGVAGDGSDHETESSSDEDSVRLGKAAISRRRRLDSIESSDSLATSPRIRPAAVSPTAQDSVRGTFTAKDGGGMETAENEGRSGYPDMERALHSEGRDLIKGQTSVVVTGTFVGQDDDDDVDRIFRSYRRRESQVQTTRDGGSPNGKPTKDSPVDDVFDEHLSPDDATTCGTLEFSLLYDSINCALYCTIIRAKGLRAMDSNGLSDPYVKLHLLPGASKANKLKTKTVHKSLNPEFNETLTYHGIDENDISRKTLRLSVLDEDTFGHDFIGEARVPLKQLHPHQTKHFNLYLDHQHPIKKDDDLLSGDNSLGKILLSLRYSSQKQGLVVGIIRCAHLPSMDSNGFSDPFAKIQLKPDPLKKKFKTAIKWRNLNPEFNEEFLFEVKLQDLSKRMLEITVWDKDYGRTNDYIGGLQVSCFSKGERLRHWLDMVKNPDQRHERWHYLSQSMLPE